MDKPLTPKHIAKLNMAQSSVRSVGLVLLIAFFAIFLSVGTLFLTGLTTGVQHLSNRLGADVMVVPEGYKADMESLLLRGEPSTFYLPSGAYEKIKDLEGIAQITPQLYVATLSASCCSYPVQVIGIAPDTDFLIKPWLGEQLSSQLKDGEALVGAKIVGESGETIHFFDQNLHIAGRLEQTGIGFDTTVFVNMDTARLLAKASERMGVNPASGADVISTLMIKVKPGVDASKMASYISKTFSNEGIFALFSKRFVNDISSNLAVIARILFFVGLLIAFLVIIILSLSYITMMNSRKKDMIILKIMGATKSMIRRIVLGEALMIGLYGAAVGVLIGAFIGLVSGPVLSRNLNLPFQTLSITGMLMVFVLTFIISVLVGVLSCLPALNRVHKKEAFTTYRACD